MDQPKKTKGELTAMRILDAAEGLFASQGYDGTSLRQIAEQLQQTRAGAIRPTLGPPGQRDHLLRERPKVFRLRQRRGDLTVLEQALGHVPTQRYTVRGGAV